MAICSSVQNIAASECIGDSLVKINNNFSNLNADACTLLTLLNQLSASVPPVGSVIKTYYEEVVGPQSFSGNQVSVGLTNPILTTGHQIFSKTIALTNTNNYFIIQPFLNAKSDLNGQTLTMIFANSTFLGSFTNESFLNPASFIIKHTPGNLNNVTYSINMAVRSGYGNLLLNQNLTNGGTYPTYFPTGKEFCSLLIQEIKG